MVKKNRQAKGERLGRLTDDDVRSIRLRHAEGEAQAKLAREYGIGKTTTWLIVHNKTWTHV
jgi:hypothetical protein